MRFRPRPLKIYHRHGPAMPPKPSDLDTRKLEQEIRKLELDVRAAQNSLAANDLEQKTRQAELRKLDTEHANSMFNIRLEIVKAWTSLLAPIMAAFTVLGTVYIGYLQVSSKSTADEDANWRQTIATIEQGQRNNLQRRHMGTLLKPFLESKRYRLAAVGVALSELPLIRDPGTFKELFDEAIPDPTLAELSSILDIDRKLSDDSGSLFGDNGLLPGKDAEWSVIWHQEMFLCGSISRILRETDRASLKKKFVQHDNTSNLIAFDDVYFEQCDFTGFDFNDVNLKYATLDWVNLTDTTLPDSMPREPRIWAGNVWWHARAVDRDLLSWLIQNFKPNQFHKAGLPDHYVERVAEDDWLKNVNRLCKKTQLNCPPANLVANFQDDTHSDASPSTAPGASATASTPASAALNATP